MKFKINAADNIYIFIIYILQNVLDLYQFE